MALPGGWLYAGPLSSDFLAEKYFTPRTWHQQYISPRQPVPPTPRTHPTLHFYGHAKIEQVDDAERENREGLRCDPWKDKCHGPRCLNNSQVGNAAPTKIYIVDIQDSAKGPGPR